MALRHPIANGISEYLELEHTEMYGEPFDVPRPDDLLFIRCSREARSSGADAVSIAAKIRSSISVRQRKTFTKAPHEQKTCCAWQIFPLIPCRLSARTSSKSV